MASNLPEHEQVQCFVTEVDADKLVAGMMDILREMSDATYKNIKDTDEDVLEKLLEAHTYLDERENAAMKIAQWRGNRENLSIRKIH